MCNVRIPEFCVRFHQPSIFPTPSVQVFWPAWAVRRLGSSTAQRRRGSSAQGFRKSGLHFSGKPTSRDIGGTRDTGGFPPNAPWLSLIWEMAPRESPHIPAPSVSPLVRLSKLFFVPQSNEEGVPQVAKPALLQEELACWFDWQMRPSPTLSFEGIPFPVHSSTDAKIKVQVGCNKSFWCIF